MEQKNIMPEKKGNDLGIERMARGAMGKLPSLSIIPFKETTKDWIRLTNQFMALIDSQNTRNLSTALYLLTSLFLTYI